MKSIRPLSQHVISQIAAGEVIERPAYAVKELIENSIDAQSDTISIDITGNGLDMITVTDNGIGMSAEDINVCFLAHTTSKLKEIEDLQRIGTLGFRGEALSSIASISSMTIKSRLRGEPVGTVVELKEGKCSASNPIGMPIGTQVVVRDIFGNVPARRKFLKSSRTEYRHILETVVSFGIMHPEITFTLVHDKKLVFTLIKTQDPLYRLQKLFSKDLLGSLMQVAYSDAYTQIRGYLGKPQFATKTLSKQYLFVNNRRIKDKAIIASIKESYATLLDPHSYPVLILFLTIPPDLVDVNVHPRKEEVRFYHKGQLQDALHTAVREQLAQHNLIFRTIPWEKEWKKSTHSYAGMMLKDEAFDWELPAGVQKENAILQVHNLYLVTEARHAVILVDQHAAHERILYEQYFEAFIAKKNKQEVYQLPTSYIFEANIIEGSLLEEYSDTFLRLGFGIEPYKDRQYIVSTVPLLFHDRDYKKLIAEMLELLSQGKIKNIDSFTQKMLSFLACRAAVKAGDSLTGEQMKELLLQLEKTPHNATCPHGRPTRVFIPKNAVDKMFRR